MYAGDITMECVTGRARFTEVRSEIVFLRSFVENS
jgi:hypothetical protein